MITTTKSEIRTGKDGFTRYMLTKSRKTGSIPFTITRLRRQDRTLLVFLQMPMPMAWASLEQLLALPNVLAKEYTNYLVCLQVLATGFRHRLWTDFGHTIRAQILAAWLGRSST